MSVLGRDVVEMYKASIRAVMRYSIKTLNQGDYRLMLKMAHPDFELAFHRACHNFRKLFASGWTPAQPALA